MPKTATTTVPAPALAFATPRKLPKVSQISGRVVVLDIAFAGASDGAFDKVTRPFIEGLGERLRGWVDHHDHELHPLYASDPRFVLATKAEHGACPEMITPTLVERLGAVDTIVCHTDFDGLASAAKWIRGGVEPYPGCDDDAWAVDTRLKRPGRAAEPMDRALRARPRDTALMGLIVRHLAQGLADEALWEPIHRAAAELLPIEQETRRMAQGFQRLAPGVALVDISRNAGRVDKTLLLMLGQEREAVSCVVDRDTVAFAARFDSGINFLQLFGLQGGMPTRVSLPRSRLSEALLALGVDAASIALAT